MSAEDSAPRDSTGTSSDNGTQTVRPDRTMALQDWLCEHRKDPYPTKGEKIMLAIMSKMTMIEVSAWFANARRRLHKKKKCNCAKMKRI